MRGSVAPFKLISSNWAHASYMGLRWDCKVYGFMIHGENGGLLPQRTRVGRTKGSSRPFPKLIPFQILLFPLHLRKFVNNLVSHPSKSKLAKLYTYFVK